MSAVGRSIVNRGILAVLIVLLAGCAAVRAFKADPAPDYGFLPNSKWLKPMPDQSPFNASWITKRRKTYGHFKAKNFKLYIPPIDLKHVNAAINEKIDIERLRKARLEEAEVAARYFHEHIKLSVEARTNQQLQIVDMPGPDTFELHLALVELRPTNPGINALGTAAGFFVPGGGLIKIIGKGEVAIEGYLKDSESGVLLEQFKDREIDRAAPFSVKDFQEYAHVRASMDDWSEQLAEILTSPVGTPIEDSLPFSINPF